MAVVDPVGSSLQSLASVLVMVGSWVATMTVLPWIWILLHEAAHVVAAVAGGARPVEAHVGKGSRVLVVRAFGTRWNLRLSPRHGWVDVRRPEIGWSRRKEIALFLAGPIASTLLVALFVWIAWTDVGFPDGRLRGVERALESAVDLGAIVLFVQAGSVWMPGRFEIDGQMRDTDVENVLRLSALKGEELQLWLDSLAIPDTATDAWDHFREGRYELALATRRRASDLGDEGLAKVTVLPIYLWPVEGARSAIAASDAALERLAGAQRDEANGGSAIFAERRAWFAENERLVRWNRAFFAMLGGTDEDRRQADEWTRAELHRRPRVALALRTRGFIDLELGDVRSGLARLERAWKLEEDAWCRALCALYLAHGHALAGDARRARRFLAKCRRIDPCSPMLPVLAPRIESARDTRRAREARRT